MYSSRGIGFCSGTSSQKSRFNENNLKSQEIKNENLIIGGCIGGEGGDEESGGGVRSMVISTD